MFVLTRNTVDGFICILRTETVHEMIEKQDGYLNNFEGKLWIVLLSVEGMLDFNTLGTLPNKFEVYDDPRVSHYFPLNKWLDIFA